MRFNLRLGVNPIIVKELRSRMRGVRAFATLTGVLLILGGISYVLIRLVLANSRYSSTPVSPQIGQALFAGLAFLELIMVCGVTPAVTAGAISGEQEKMTYEMLLATPLRPVSILWGKLVSALGYVFLLLFAAVPMASLVFIFGGVSPRDMLKSLVVLVVTAIMIGVIGLFMSALFGRSGRATVLTYFIVLAMLFAPMFFAIATGVMRQSEPPRWILVPSPFNALSSALAPSVSTGGGGIFYILGGAFWGLGATPISQVGIPRPLYHYSLPLFGFITLVLYLAATRLVQPTRRWRISWKQGLLAVGILGGYAGLVALGFFATSGRYESFDGGNQVNPGFQGFAPAMPVPAVVERQVIQQAVPEESGEEGTEENLSTPTPLPPPGAGAAGNSNAVVDDFSLADQTDIYTAVINQLLIDESFAKLNPGVSVLDLVEKTDDEVGDPNTPRSTSRQLPQEVQGGVLAAMKDAGIAAEWILDPGGSPTEMPKGGVAVKGALIRLGNLHLQEDGSVLAPAAIYFYNGTAGGKTYRLSQIDGFWQVDGDTDNEWTVNHGS